MTGALPSILLAHGRPGIARAVTAVLHRHGYDVTVTRDGEATQAALEARRWDALVVDVGLPGVPSYELVRVAKAASDPDAGAVHAVLVAAVYRRTSYKRRPARLYGADDYVEIHHLGDMLPKKLDALLGKHAGVDASSRQQVEETAAEALRQEGDTRMEQIGVDELASLIVSDMILYNGDEILEASSIDAARHAVADDLEMARELLVQVARARGEAPPKGDPAAAAFGRLMKELGREAGNP